MNIAIIPARGGSRRIPKKNIRPFFGKPIIAYSIEAAKASGLFGRVCVSTDDQEIASIALAFEAEVLERPPSFAQDDVGTQEVMRGALAALRKASNGSIDYACCIYATAPLMSLDDLAYGLDVLVRYDYSFTFSVGANPLRDAGQFYWGNVEAFLKADPLIGPDTGMIPISESRICDINTEDDWLRAERMYMGLHNLSYSIP
jgi:pseudaminic acid cytidylyltransferase